MYPIEHLPIELHQNILDQLHPKELSKIMKVFKRWRPTFYHNYIVISNREEDSDFASCRNLTDLPDPDYYTYLEEMVSINTKLKTFNGIVILEYEGDSLCGIQVIVRIIQQAWMEAHLENLKFMVSIYQFKGSRSDDFLGIVSALYNLTSGKRAPIIYLNMGQLKSWALTNTRYNLSALQPFINVKHVYLHKSDCTLKGKMFPRLDTVKVIRPTTFEIDELQASPYLIYLCGIPKPITLNSSISEHLEELTITCESANYGRTTLLNCEFPKLRTLTIKANSNFVDPLSCVISNVKAPVLRSFLVHEAHAIDLYIEEFDAPKLLELDITTRSLTIKGDNPYYFPSLNSFSLEIFDFEDNRGITGSLNIGPNIGYSFLENCENGEIFRNARHILGGLNMKRINSLYIEVASGLDTHLCSNIKFPCLSMLTLGLTGNGEVELPTLEVPYLYHFKVTGLKPVATNLNVLLNKYKSVRRLEICSLSNNITLENICLPKLERLRIEIPSRKDFSMLDCQFNNIDTLIVQEKKNTLSDFDDFDDEFNLKGTGVNFSGTCIESLTSLSLVGFFVFDIPKINPDIAPKLRFLEVDGVSHSSHKSTGTIWSNRFTEAILNSH
ncbi:hypothetical protein BN7_6585 [Wickerhamomyces ciferrii]|uniref:F-box domain-containing protein n=1 Tax=Wickerhamomyces ciferrii (strain ATCC 14091 / BCRC 22168 / CBS 111 / JCM 3599 / NBRC 0793 / NRRL Y-1031 F-60-10) TaxID=1206466 RepID=K0L0L1_WICCF|nr:uncharacterized protein BN7_6585 [Wickerhamomyces ciferrii]CCH46978.1 hypothetical protein BN7_6585 [Wickerhamomyces ciferrii]